MTIFRNCFACTTASAALPDAAEPIAAMRQYVDGFNQGDVEAIIARAANERTRRTGATRLARGNGLPVLVPRRVGGR